MPRPDRRRGNVPKEGESNEAGRAAIKAHQLRFHVGVITLCILYATEESIGRPAFLLATGGLGAMFLHSAAVMLRTEMCCVGNLETPSTKAERPAFYYFHVVTAGWLGAWFVGHAIFRSLSGG